MTGVEKPVVTVRWHIERLIPARKPYWSVRAIRDDPEIAAERLRMFRQDWPNHQWRIKVVTTFTSEKILNA